MASMLQDLRDEWQAFENLLDGLYGWLRAQHSGVELLGVLSIGLSSMSFHGDQSGALRLASPTSLLYDAALLRRVRSQFIARRWSWS